MIRLTLSDHPERTDDILIDDSKEAQVRDLGLALKDLELNGNYFGEFSLTAVIYDLELAKVERACADFYKVFKKYLAVLETSHKTPYHLNLHHRNVAHTMILD